MLGVFSRQGSEVLQWLLRAHLQITHFVAAGSWDYPWKFPETLALPDFLNFTGHFSDFSCLLVFCNPFLIKIAGDCCFLDQTLPGTYLKKAKNASKQFVFHSLLRIYLHRVDRCTLLVHLFKKNQLASNTLKVEYFISTLWFLTSLEKTQDLAALDVHDRIVTKMLINSCPFDMVPGLPVTLIPLFSHTWPAPLGPERDFVCTSINEKLIW